MQGAKKPTAGDYYIDVVYDKEDEYDKDNDVNGLGNFLHSQVKPVFKLLPGLVLGLAMGLLSLLGQMLLSTQD